MKITFNKLSNFLYEVFIDGKKSVLSVTHDGGEFVCYQRGFFNIHTKTLDDMRALLEGEI